MEIIYNALSRLGLTAGSKAAPTGAVNASVRVTSPTNADEMVTTSPAETNPHTQPKKTTKRRKSQSEEDYEAQKNEFWATGPIIQESDKDLYDRLDSLDPSSKFDRATIVHAAERAYYRRDYKRSLEVLDRAKDWDVGTKDLKELDVIRAACEKKLAQA